MLFLRICNISIKPPMERNNSVHIGCAELRYQEAENPRNTFTPDVKCNANIISGWTCKMLLPLLDHRYALDGFCIVLCAFNLCRLPCQRKVFPLLVNLLTIKKKNHEPIPIAIGRIFYSLVIG